MGNLDAFFNLPPLIKRLQEAIKPSEIYLVGGAVRDGLLDRPMHDYDLATNLPARQIMLKARAAGLKANLVQAEQAYPVVIVESEGFKLEVPDSQII